MSQILLPPWNVDWFSRAFSNNILQLAHTRYRLPPDLFPDERLTVMGEFVMRRRRFGESGAHSQVESRAIEPTGI